jgi:signal transduction histidine kinase/CheY-like chemotaxis protein
MPDVDRGAQTPSIVTDDAGQYEITLQTLVFPIAGHLVFNAWWALGALLLGHPWIAASGFAGGMSMDLLQQTLVRGWLKRARDVDEAVGMARVAVLCAVRTVVALVPLGLLALQGGTAELMLAAITVVSLVALGQTVGGMSRLLFWAYIGPSLAGIGLVAVLRLPPGMLAGVLVGLASCAVIMWMLSNNTSQVILAWRAEYEAKKTAIGELEAARDEARHANRSKSNFLATMSHEIRTPMNGVLGMAQLLKRDEADPRQVERLDVLIDSGEYLLSILNDVLDVSKIDAGKLDISPAPETLSPFLQRIVTFWGARADERGVGLRLRVEPGLPEAILVDGLRLRQILFNLIGNALKFTETGSVDLVAAPIASAGGDPWIRYTVRDTGPGIADEHLPALFDRFSQVDDGEVRKFGGTGLGLAIVRRLSELMGGSVWVESALGVGSAFHVDLPVALADPAAASAPAPVAKAAEPEALQPLRVLAVDDNAVNLLVLEQLLSSLGQTVVRAAGAREALAILAGEPFDLVLTDIQMPEMTGIELLEALRASSSPNQAVPVVALTADVTSGGRQRYLDLGFSEHAAKPIQLPELLGAISRAMTPPPADSDARAA